MIETKDALKDMNIWKDTIKEMRERGMKTPSIYPHFRIANTKDVFSSAFEYVLSFEKKKLIWVPEYDKVVEWMIDNEEKGLFLYGKVGNGKSIIARYVLPAIFLKCLERVIHVYDMSELDYKLDEAKGFKFVTLDDIGTESTIVNYGKKREAFDELLDNAEKTGKMLIVSSNFSKEKAELVYGSRAFDRIKRLMKMIPFNNESFR